HLPPAQPGEPVQVTPVELSGARIGLREPGPVAEQGEAELLAEEAVVRLQLLRVPRELELVELQLLLPVRRPAPDMAGVERACQRPRAHASPPCGRRRIAGAPPSLRG